MRTYVQTFTHCGVTEESLEAETEASKKGISAVSQEISALNARIAESGTNKAALRDAKQHLFDELKRKKEGYDQRIQELQKKLAGMRSTPDNEDPLHRELREQLQKEQNGRDQAEQMMNELTAELNEIRKQMQMEALMRQKLEREREQKEREREQLQAKHDASMAKLRRLLDEAMQTEARLGGEVETNRLVLTDRVRERDQLALDTRTMKARIQKEDEKLRQLDLESQRAEKDAERTDAQRRYEESVQAEKDKVLRDKKKDRKKARNALDMAITERDYQEKLRDATAEEVRDLELELDAEERRTSAAQKTARELRAQHQELLDRTDEQREMAEEAAAAAERKRQEELAALETKLNEAQRRAQAIQKSLSAARDKHAADAEQFAKSAAAHEDAIARHGVKERKLRSQLESERSELTNVREADRAMAQSLARAQELCKDRQGHTHAAQRKVRKHAADKAKAEKSLELAQKSKAASDEAKRSAQGKLEASRLRADEAAAQRKKRADELNAAHDALAALHEEAAGASTASYEELLSARKTADAELERTQAQLGRGAAAAEAEAKLTQAEIAKLQQQLAE